ncbi:zinc-finger homeodomain protein 1-like [Apium graveolens]|uniref:zinc-finger homeodomain protein 1-like n=1 Tax=Apium graveolens TaxID=4045 RepID=UPI003D79F760
MDFEEHDDQDEEIGMHMPPTNYDSMMRPRIGGSGEGGSMVAAATSTRKIGGYKYKECLKNHAVGIGGSAVDGCGEFMAAGEEGTLDALKCAACNCHRNFHRRESEGEGALGTLGTLGHVQQHQYYHRPSGYLHVTPMSQQRPLALPSNSRELEMDEDMSNPSSSGGGGGGGRGGPSGGLSPRKRFRTKFTPDQKERMLELAERLGWRIQKQDEALVQNFCAETGLKRHVLKVWMHNNKHTLGKKLP